MAEVLKRAVVSFVTTLELVFCWTEIQRYAAKLYSADAALDMFETLTSLVQH